MASLASRAENYGRGTVEIDAEFVEERDVLERLRTAFRAPDYEPPLLPAAALQLLELARSPDASVRDVLDVLEYDPFIAGRVLRLAQSPAYGAATPVRSLEQGVSRLGMNTMAEIFFHVSVSSRVFRAKGYEKAMDALRNHSVAVAHVARLVCRATSLPDEYAFLCGLLHDVGIAAGLIVLADVRAPKAPPPLFEIQRPVIEAHAEAGTIVCASWKLPPDVCLVIEHHHHPTIGGVMHPMAAALGVAEEICRANGFAAPAEEVAAQPNVFESLNLGGVIRRRLEADAKALLGRLT